MKNVIFPLLLLAAISISSRLCFADTVYTVIVKKQEEKSKTRWSLSEWLETRDRMRLQDLWLALHSSSPYEFFLAGNYQINQTSLARNFNTYEGSAGAFVSIFGLEGHLSSGLFQIISGLFDLRIFGFHDQGTQITLQLGIRNRADSNSYFRNGLGGFKFSIYLAKPFGIDGYYHHYFSSSLNSVSIPSLGTKYQIGAFLEYQFLRFYGAYMSETETTYSATGVIFGSKLYF